MILTRVIDCRGEVSIRVRDVHGVRLREAKREHHRVHHPREDGILLRPRPAGRPGDVNVGAVQDALGATRSPRTRVPRDRPAQLRTAVFVAVRRPHVDRRDIRLDPGIRRGDEALGIRYAVRHRKLIKKTEKERLHRYDSHGIVLLLPFILSCNYARRALAALTAFAALGEASVPVREPFPTPCAMTS